jgi:hypothetical protein
MLLMTLINGQYPALAGFDRTVLSITHLKKSGSNLGRYQLTALKPLLPYR